MSIEAVPRADLGVTGLRSRIGGLELEADFAVGAGERVGLVGPSGSGKTSLLRAIAGLDPIEAGSIRLGDTELSGLAPKDRRIGFVFQEPALFPALSVIENAAFGLRMRGAGRGEREKEAMHWLEAAGIAGLRDRSVDSLSGGEAQRVAWIRALIWKPGLILLDEPFSALDRDARSGLQRHLLNLHARRPVPMILVSHDEQDVAALSTRVLRFEVSPDGRKRRVFDSH